MKTILFAASLVALFVGCSAQAQEAPAPTLPRVHAWQNWPARAPLTAENLARKGDEKLAIIKKNEAVLAAQRADIAQMKTDRAAAAVVQKAQNEQQVLEEQAGDDAVCEEGQAARVAEASAYKMCRVHYNEVQSWFSSHCHIEDHSRYVVNTYIIRGEIRRFSEMVGDIKTTTVCIDMKTAPKEVKVVKGNADFTIDCKPPVEFHVGEVSCKASDARASVNSSK